MLTQNRMHDVRTDVEVTVNVSSFEFIWQSKYIKISKFALNVIPEAPEMSVGGGGDIIAVKGITSPGERVCGPWGGRGGGGGGNLGFKGIKTGRRSSWSTFMRI